MLFDRCILTKNHDEWIGMVEMCQRIGEQWRFAAYVTLIIVVVELFRLAMAGFWYFNNVEFVILGISIFFTIAFFRKSSKTFRYRETVFKIPKPDEITDAGGNIIGQRQRIMLPENGEYKSYDIRQFTHVVFGLIDYPWPGRKNVNIDAFALYLASADGTPKPIVEGSFDKFSCYGLARRLSALTKIPLIELGKGQPFKPEEK